MRAENDGFVGLFAAANFADDIFLFDGAADFVRHREAHANFAGVGGNGARQAHGVFARKDCLRNNVELAVASIGVPVQQQTFARAHPQNCGGAAFHGAIDDGRRLRILVEQIGPGRANLGINQKDRAFNRSACRAKSSGVP